VDRSHFAVSLLTFDWEKRRWKKNHGGKRGLEEVKNCLERESEKNAQLEYAGYLTGGGRKKGREGPQGKKVVDLTTGR